MCGLNPVQQLSLLPAHGVETVSKTTAHDTDRIACMNSVLNDFAAF